MPKDWETQRLRIEELYIGNARTLRDVRQTMIDKHGFTASPRSYKMKLDEWNIRKYKSKNLGRGRASEAQSRSSKSPSCSATRSTSVASESSEDTIVQEQPVQHFFPQLPEVLSDCHSQLPIWSCLHPMPVPTLSFPKPLQHPETSRTPPPRMAQCGPLVNSSLQFFSTQTDTGNLHRLSKFPGIAPRALEIVLRNWKDGGEYLSYATFLLQNSDCCQTIVGVNYTRWNHRDETSLDLVDENVGTSEQSPLFKLLLRADLRFQHPLSAQCPLWAEIWRISIQQPDWKRAKDRLMILEFQPVLLNSAFVVVAERYLENIKRKVAWWRTDRRLCPEPILREYRELVLDCNVLRLEVSRAALAINVQEMVEVVRERATGGV